MPFPQEVLPQKYSLSFSSVAPLTLFKQSKVHADHNVPIYILAVVVLAGNEISSRPCLERAA